MTDARRVYLTGITSELGAPFSLRDLPAVRADPRAGADFEAAGFASFRKAAESPSVLACAAMARTLAATGVDPQSIDYVFYCCEFNHGAPYYQTMHEVCVKLGLVRAFPIGVYMTGCGNSSSGLQLAASLIRTGQARRALLVAADCFEDDRRLQQPAVALLSDGAACCLLTADRAAAGYEVEHTDLHVRHGMGSMNPSDDFLRYNMESYRGRLDAADALYGRIGEDAAIRALIAANYGASTLRNLAADFRVAEDLLFKGTVADMGHVGSVDTLVNLAACAAASPPAAGDRYVVVSSGPASWGVSTLRAV